MKARNALCTVARSAFKFKLYSSSSAAAAAAAREAFSNKALKLAASAEAEDSSELLPSEVCSLLKCDTEADLQETDDAKSLNTLIAIPLFPQKLTGRRRIVGHERKSRYVFGNRQGTRIDDVINMCANRLGTGVVLQVFSRLNKETGGKECNAVIKKCIEGARIAAGEAVAEEHMQLAFSIINSMKEHGFPLDKETYGPFLEYLIDMGMTEEFFILCGVIKNNDPSSLARLGYYEMMLWIRINHEEKIQELCNDLESFDGSLLQENYLLALCESDRTKDIVQLFESMDVTKFSSPKIVAQILKSLGRLLLESCAAKVLLEFKAFDSALWTTSDLIYSYVVGIPNLAAEDVISKFRNLHKKYDVTPSSVPYEKLIICCCDSFQVHLALELVDEMFELGLTCSLGALHSVLQASAENCDFDLVHRIYSVIERGNLRPNAETFRSMIYLCVKMNDYVGAYNMLCDSEKIGVSPTSSMYNAIMVGYFREKNTSCGFKVLKEMKEGNVKPDSLTFSYLIANCNSEEDINMYYEEMKQSQIKATKPVFMALINAYAACGQFEKAKQVLLDQEIPPKSFNEIRSVLVQALASHGQLSNAFDLYEKIKEDGLGLEPKAVISLIEHSQFDEAALNRLLLLLETIKDPNYWLDGCLRMIIYCVRYKHLRTAVNLLEQVRDQVCTDELTLEVIFDKVFSFIAESESSLQFGLNLLHAMKSELGLIPSRKCLDFLLHACVTAKDLQSSLFVWQEYQAAGLPYNTLTFLRMYQALLASGDRKAAKVLEQKIPKADPHVQAIIAACTWTYLKKEAKKKKKKKKNKKNMSKTN